MNVILCAVFIISYFSPSMNYQPYVLPNEKQNFIIIDAGSTGSRLRLYSSSKNKGEQSTFKLEEKSYKLPALTSIAENRATIFSQFCDVIVREGRKMVKDANKVIIYIMATAGMRGVPEENATFIMNSIRTYFSDTKKSPFLFKSYNCRIISGAEEAAFAWISVNYLNGRFLGNNSKTSGILELGGASMQIAFRSRKPMFAQSFPIKLYGTVHNIYAKSYYSLGMSFLHRTIYEYLKSRNVNVNPCLLKGDSKTKDSISYSGSGNYSECSRVISESMKLKTKRCVLRPCAIRSQYQPSIDEKSPKFYLLGAFTNSLRSLRKSLSDEEFKDIGFKSEKKGFVIMKQIETASNYFCSKTKAELIKKGIKEKYASSDCSVSIYLLQVMKALGFDELNQVYGMNIVKEGNIKPEWTLGAVIYENYKYNTCSHKSSSVRISSVSSASHATFYTLNLLAILQLSHRIL